MYIIEGNIGVGKSTFLKLINKCLPHVNISLEPLNNWQKQVYGQSLLTNFYQDTKRWAYTLETLTMVYRVREHIAQQQKNDSACIVERSIYSGYYCFAKNGYEQGFMSDLEWQLYLQWFAWLVYNKCQPPHGFIYLRVDPKIAYERIKKRNRHAEKAISLGYLRQIHEKHEKFLSEKEEILPILQSIPVLILDCNKEFETDIQQLEKHLQKVEDFLIKTTQYELKYQKKELQSPE